MSYNTRGLCLGEKLADKARRLVVDKLLEETDILRLQETFFAKDLDKLNSVNSNFQGAGESTTDLSLELVHGRIAGGVAIMWHRKYDSLTSIIGRLGVDWCIAITVAYNNNVFIVLNVYTPCEFHSREDEFLQNLAFISLFLEENEFTCIYVMRDINADISDSKSLLG